MKIGILVFAVAIISLGTAFYCNKTNNNVKSSISVLSMVTDPTPPGPANPYCTPPTFSTMPSFECPEGHTANFACVTECFNTYKEAVTKAYADACAAWNDANTTYVRCAKLALQNYDTCFAAATTLAEREACRDACVTSISSCVNTLMASRATITSNFDSAVASALSTFLACALACCS